MYVLPLYWKTFSTQNVDHEVVRILKKHFVTCVESPFLFQGHQGQGQGHARFWLGRPDGVVASRSLRTRGPRHRPDPHRLTEPRQARV